MPDINEKVRVRLRKLRIEAGLTQEQLAEAAGPGISSASVSRYERGAATPPLHVLERLAECLGHDLASFFAWSEPSRPPPSALRRIVSELAPLSEDQLHAAGDVLIAHLRGVQLAEQRKRKRPPPPRRHRG